MKHQHIRTENQASVYLGMVVRKTCTIVDFLIEYIGPLQLCLL